MSRSSDPDTISPAADPVSMPTETKPASVVHADHVDHPEDAVQGERDVRNDDLGAKFMAEYTGPRPEITQELNDAVQRKIDRWLLPIIFYVYWCQQLDKSSLSFASIFGLQTDTHLVGQQYSWLGSIVYFAQLVFQPLSVYALVRFPVNYWICFCFVGWGASLCLMAAASSFAGLAVLRFMLGAFEASISPSMLVLVAMWWTRREQILRNNMWYSANGLAQILGSLISYGLGQTSTNHLKHYQSIFLACGLIAVALSIPTFFLLPRHPATAVFLSQEQKYIALERIRLNNTGTQNTHFKWEHVRECFIDPKTWMWVIMIFCISLVSGGIGTFGPLILRGFGLDTLNTILYNMIPGGIGIVSNIGTALIIQHTKYKSPTLFVVSLFPLAAAAALYALPRDPEYNHSLLAVYFILQVFQCISPIIFSWAFANTAGHTKKTTTTGLIYVGLTVGNIVGPQLYKTAEQPYYRTGLTGNLVVLCILSGLIVAQALYLSFLNKRNYKRRVAAGKVGQHVDYSLEASSKWASIKGKQLENEKETGVREEYNANAFKDLTDLQNEDFVYSL